MKRTPSTPHNVVTIDPAQSTRCVFGLRDRWHQLEYRWLGRRPSQAGSEPVETFDSGGNVITAQAVVDTHDPHWPPPRIAPGCCIVTSSRPTRCSPPMGW